MPARRLGIAVKIESGSEEASGCAALEYLRQLGVLAEHEMEPLQPCWQCPVSNCTGMVVGQYRAAFPRSA
ncbi:MAG TPA: asparaginase [Armatimonadota bacterium]